ncbi:hypothetical protein D0C36_17285 [Mucilaginibacter conchicola]|uniref:Uncharacterized protein n=1 Tax=Mucilaginibacter conchicola TaxID=2303333 RepID=A0A372NP49_9SPHI|nr:4'-phosphopantetheinyl transferase superfamily protein [Mucilaginibacter conchicola]RFZ90714.1 hypothetical protein D0C36_17285 [Mucilaginibacter conchicola]
MGTLTNRFINNVNWETTAGELALPQQDEVHVWRIQISANIYRLDDLRKLLTPEEISRGDKYHQLKDRQRFVVGRGLQRIVLGKYLNQEPARLNFVLGDNKKPYLPAGDGMELHYNVSHSGNWIMLAVSQDPVGADVEFIDSVFPFDDILPEHFSANEIAYIKSLDKTNLFYKLWTRKEAFLKATGQGLGEHLRDTPSLDGEHELKANLYGAHKDWNQQSFFVADGYMASVAAVGEWWLKAFDINF